MVTSAGLGFRAGGDRTGFSRKLPAGRFFMRQYNVFRHPFQWSFTWTTLSNRVDPSFEKWIEKAVKSYRPTK